MAATSSAVAGRIRRLVPDEPPPEMPHGLYGMSARPLFFVGSAAVRMIARKSE